MAAQARRELSGRVLAATLRSVRDLDIAEEATADAFLLALQSWPTSGIPSSVEAWLITAARRRAVDKIRRAQVARLALVKAAGGWSGVTAPADAVATAALVGDDELRMVVLCCDPRITRDEQVALTLRLACGVSTAGIAAAFRVSTATMAARLTRAKAKLVRAGPALDLPDDATVDERLPVVGQVVHLAFTLGHTRSDGTDLTDEDLADRAQYLAGVLHTLRPDRGEFTALLSLVLLTRARFGGRFADDGSQVLLAEADRSRWDHRLVEQGLALLRQAFRGSRPFGPMTWQAAIAAEHARASSFAATDWGRVVELYGRLLEVDPSPVTAIGRCLAVSQLSGPAVGLEDLDEVLAIAPLPGYPYAAAARAQLLETVGAPCRGDGRMGTGSGRGADGCRGNIFRRSCCSSARIILTSADEVLDSCPSGPKTSTFSRASDVDPRANGRRVVVIRAPAGKPRGVDPRANGLEVAGAPLPRQTGKHVRNKGETS